MENKKKVVGYETFNVSVKLSGVVAALDKKDVNYTKQENEVSEIIKSLEEIKIELKELAVKTPKKMKKKKKVKF